MLVVQISGLQKLKKKFRAVGPAEVPPISMCVAPSCCAPPSTPDPCLLLTIVLGLQGEEKGRKGRGGAIASRRGGAWEAGGDGKGRG